MKIPGELFDNAIAEIDDKSLCQHEDAIAPLYKDYSLKFWEMSLAGDEVREKALIASKERYVKVYNNREEFRRLQEWRKANRLSMA